MVGIGHTLWNLACGHGNLRNKGRTTEKSGNFHPYGGRPRDVLMFTHAQGMRLRRGRIVARSSAVSHFPISAQRSAHWQVPRRIPSHNFRHHQTGRRCSAKYPVANGCKQLIGAVGMAYGRRSIEMVLLENLLRVPLVSSSRPRPPLMITYPGVVIREPICRRLGLLARTVGISVRNSIGVILGCVSDWTTFLYMTVFRRVVLTLTFFSCTSFVDEKISNEISLISKKPASPFM